MYMRNLLVVSFVVAAFVLNVSAFGAFHVDGPIPSTPESHPFGGAAYTRVPQDLAAFGYVEEEYFLSGTANIYDWPESGPATVRTAGAPYTTRVLVRRPIDGTKFSGNVIVEMLNPSNLFDLNLAWAISHEQFVRNGDGWVGMTAKPIAVASLQTFDPVRYAPLSWKSPLAPDDPRGCALNSRDTTHETENGLVWDMYTQLGAWLRNDDASNPFRYGGAAGAHPVERLYGWGYSQTGSFLYTYINAIHPLVVNATGKTPYDGYIVAVASGPSSINQCAERLAEGDPRRQFKNVGVPIFRIMTQSDYLRTVSARRPNSDEPGDRYRNYEIAGSGHASPEELMYCASPADIEKAGRTVPPMECNEGSRSRFPNSVFFNAAIANLDKWVRDGTPAPRAEPIEVVNGKPVLDEHGNVRGGVRSPFVDVPTSTWMGNSTGPSFCVIAGHEIPFDREKLKALYADHDAYVRAVIANVELLVTQRFITKADGDALVEAAELANVP